MQDETIDNIPGYYIIYDEARLHLAWTDLLLSTTFSWMIFMDLCENTRLVFRYEISTLFSHLLVGPDHN